VKFRTERDTFLEALVTASRAATTRGASAVGSPSLLLVLSGGRLEIAGFDPDLVIESWTEVAGEGDGSAHVPARLVVDIVRSFDPGLIDVVADDETVRLGSGNAEFEIRVPPGSETVRPERVDSKPIELPADSFATALRQVARAALVDESRAPQLTGVLMATREAGGVRLVATDSYRLAYRDLPGLTALDPGQQVLIPARALNEVARLAAGQASSQSQGEDGGAAAHTLTFKYTDLDAVFEVAGVRLTTRLLRGTFPEYERLIPERFTNVVRVGREDLATALRRVRLLVRDAKDTTTPVRLALGADGIELTVITAESGRAVERIEAQHEGDEVTVAFNPTYLLEGVEAIQSDTVMLEAIDSTKPAMVRGVDDPSYSYLLMPVRVS
jgi:DNA polymerase-3 subunit beta